MNQGRYRKLGATGMPYGKIKHAFFPSNKLCPFLNKAPLTYVVKKLKSSYLNFSPTPHVLSLG